MFKRFIAWFKCYKFQRNGYSEITGEFGKYYTKRGSNTVLFIPEPCESRIPRGLAKAVAELVDQLPED
jgi:hypothetical protein